MSRGQYYLVPVAEHRGTGYWAPIDESHLHVGRGYGEVTYQVFHRGTKRKMNQHSMLRLAISRQRAS